MHIQHEPHQYQLQHLMLTPAMQQAFQVLQMPLIELEQWVQTQIEENPILEWEEQGINEHKGGHIDSSFLMHQPTLFEHLMQQARQTIDDPQDLVYAERFIGSLDEQGFFRSAEEIPARIIQTVQTFDPPGIGASSLQESLLIQLRLKEKQNTWAYQIIEYHFEDLLHNRREVIRKQLQCTLDQLDQIIRQEIAPLDTHPGYQFCHRIIPLASPDLIIKQDGEGWSIEICKGQLPEFRINTYYLDLKHPYVQKQIASAQWIKKIVSRRNETLRQIGVYLLQKQRLFFEGESSTLFPLTLREMARHLNMHETTAARAVAHKYLECSNGLFPLRFFFSQHVSYAPISTDQAKKMLLKLIREEDKVHPLSDQALAVQMDALGVPCSRRTVTKYRQYLNINSASQRRKFS